MSHFLENNRSFLKNRKKYIYIKGRINRPEEDDNMDTTWVKSLLSEVWRNLYHCAGLLVSLTPAVLKEKSENVTAASHFILMCEKMSGQKGAKL